jgi:predicted metalloprotease with PDZ domain
MASSITYRITPKNPAAHLFEVTLTIEAPAAQQRVWLPVWIPGSYMVREFSRHIVTVTARADGAPVPLSKVDKHTWEAGVSGQQRLEVTATIYAWDLSVRAAHLDLTHGFWNATSLCLAVAGREHEPCDVIIEPPADERCKGWKVATTLPMVDVRMTGPTGGFGRYRAKDYDELCDHPVEMGTFDLVEFEAGGVPHQVAITGRTRVDGARLAKDLTAICNEHVKLFHGDGDHVGRAPMDRYLFLTMAVGDGYGGLEHRASTALVCKRADLPAPGMGREPGDGYRGFLGLASHEYFHTWNVKRIKPAAFSPYDLRSEGYTKQLWAFEGITSYYDDLALVRAGVIDESSFLELLGRTVTRVLRWSGRFKMSLEDASWDAWIKYYRQDENTPNSQVSYYTKGSLVALAADVTIRQATEGRKSLDDVMRLLFERYGDNVDGRGPGVPEGGVEAICSEVAGIDMTPFFDEYLRGTNDVPLGGLLEPFGIRLHVRPLESDADQGGKPGKADADKRGTLNVSLGAGDDGAHLGVVHDGGAAQLAGLSAGDVIIAVDGLKVTRGTLNKVIGDHAPGDRVKIHAFRRDELFEVEATVGAPDKRAAWFTLDDHATPEQLARRAAWLGTGQRSGG